MKHSRSSAEQEIRDTLVDFCRTNLPRHRLIHELNTNGTGSRRVDLAAIGHQEIITWEIKSERDKLDRLKDQWNAFDACSHHSFVIAHRKWFTEKEVSPGHQVLEPHEKLKDLKSWNLWAYPQPEGRHSNYQWRVERWDAGFQPRASAMLSLLWRDELFEECSRHNILVGKRATITTMIKEMCWLMKGREVAEAVCRQLRARPFAEADQPVFDESFRSHLHRPRQRVTAQMEAQL